MLTYQNISLIHLILIDFLIYHEKHFIMPLNMEYPAFLHPSGFYFRQICFNSVSSGQFKNKPKKMVPLLSSHCIQTLRYHPVYYSFYACRVLIKQRLPGQMSEATQRGKSEGNCRTSQGSKFFFPTFPYLLLVVCSEAVLACFRGYGLWAHAWYLCHFHGSKKNLCSSPFWVEKK